VTFRYLGLNTLVSSIKCVCFILCMCVKILMQRQKAIFIIIKKLGPLVLNG
jgi:hypothetical protein